MVFLTNNLKLAAATVAEIYKNRWQIELVFRALKQSCKVKTFVGTSASALNTQIWTALIAILLVKILHMKSRFGWHLPNFCVLLRQSAAADSYTATSGCGSTIPSRRQKLRRLRWSWSSFDLDSRAKRLRQFHSNTAAIERPS